MSGWVARVEAEKSILVWAVIFRVWLLAGAAIIARREHCRYLYKVNWVVCEMIDGARHLKWKNWWRRFLNVYKSWYLERAIYSKEVSRPIIRWEWEWENHRTNISELSLPHSPTHTLSYTYAYFTPERQTHALRQPPSQKHIYTLTHIHTHTRTEPYIHTPALCYSESRWYTIVFY